MTSTQISFIQNVSILCLQPSIFDLQQVAKLSNVVQVKKTRDPSGNDFADPEKELKILKRKKDKMPMLRRMKKKMQCNNEKSYSERIESSGFCFGSRISFFFLLFVVVVVSFTFKPSTCGIKT